MSIKKRKVCIFMRRWGCFYLLQDTLRAIVYCTFLCTVLYCSNFSHSLMFSYQQYHYSGCRMSGAQCYFCVVLLFFRFRLQTEPLSPTRVEWHSWGCVYTDVFMWFSLIFSWNRFFLPAALIQTGRTGWYSRCPNDTSWVLLNDIIFSVMSVAISTGREI